MHSFIFLKIQCNPLINAGKIEKQDLNEHLISYRLTFLAFYVFLYVVEFKIVLLLVLVVVGLVQLDIDMVEYLELSHTLVLYTLNPNDHSGLHLGPCVPSMHLLKFCVVK